MAWVAQMEVGEVSLTMRPKIILVIELAMAIEASCLLIFRAKHFKLVQPKQQLALLLLTLNHLMDYSM